jgi:hypothetical protein
LRYNANPRRFEYGKVHTDDRTGPKYELGEDYFFFIAGDDELENEPIIGISGRRRLWYLKVHRQALYTLLLLCGKLDDHITDIDDQA